MDEYRSVAGFLIGSLSWHFQQYSSRVTRIRWRRVSPCSSGSIASTVCCFSSFCRCIAAAPSTKLKRGEAAALIGTSKGTVLLWDCVSDQEIWRLTGQTSVTDVDFSLGGRHAASSHWGRKVNLLDIERREVIHAFTGYEGPVNSVVFSPDGSLLISSCGAGKTIRVWNVASREELARAVADEHSTRHSAMSPDGTSIVSGGGYFFDRVANKFSNDGDYAIRLWQLLTASSR